ncbi:hypothetical protein JW890_09420 [candidate division WOR-3 bacterium]|nr:hypothetical protein [candidate division WOR-3 bacterium]
MKIRLLQCAAVFMLTAMAVTGFSCSSSTGTGPSGGGGGTTTPEENYFGVTPSGDMVTLNIDFDAKEYTFVNITTGDTTKGTFTVSSDPNYSGAYITSNNHYIIEVPGEIFITSVPLGNKQFGITFGITSHRNLNNSALEGNYIFIVFVSEGFADWGGFTINANGTYTYGTAPEPSQITSPFNYFQGTGSGTWQVSPVDSSRIIFTEGSIVRYGTVDPGKTMIIQGNGEYILGVKYPPAPVPFSDVAGRYTAIDYDTDDGRGIGYFQVPSSSAPVNYYFKYQNNNIVSGATPVFQRHDYVNNMFYTSNTSVYEEFIGSLILPGHVIMYFRFENFNSDSLVGSGIGAKL